MRQTIDHLKTERMSFDSIYKKLEAELEDLKKQMADVIEKSNQVSSCLSAWRFDSMFDSITLHNILSYNITIFHITSKSTCATHTRISASMHACVDWSPLL